MALIIRSRHRIGYSREAGGYTGWTEWQLVDGRRIVGRFDLEEQAQREKAAREGDAIENTTAPDRENSHG